MRSIPLLSLFILFTILGTTIIGQKPPPPPPPAKPKPTPVEAIDRTEEEVTAAIIKTLEKPVDWKQRSLAGFPITVDLPRDVVRQTETFEEKGFGRMQMVMYVSVGEEAIFIIGKLSLPYSVTDEKVLRDLYRGFASGMAEDGGSSFQHVSDFQFEGRLGVEMRSLPDDILYQPSRSRAFVLGRDVFIMLAMPSENEDEHEPPGKELIESRSKDFERFLGSVNLVSRPKAPAIAESPLFRSTWIDGVFTSERFRFSYEPPSGWTFVPQDDVNSLRDWTNNLVRESSGMAVPTARQRRNLATMVSAPLGSDGIAMVSFNLALPSNSYSDVRTLANETEKLVKGISVYKNTKRPFETTVGGVKAVSLENIVNVAGIEQQQKIFFFLREGYVLSVTITCVNSEDCTQATESLSSLKFLAK